jgi:hypothetical protein
MAYVAGGRLAGRLMARLGMPRSKDTLLRALKCDVRVRADQVAVRVVGVDDWSWRKGTTYGTIMVDLERRLVLDILQDRSADTTVGWLEEHPPVEMVSRDRFHLLQNLRHATEQQLIRAPRTPLPLAPSETVSLTEPPGLIHRYGSPEVTEHHRLVQEGRHARARTRFDRVRALHAKGMRLAEIMHETGLHSRTASPTAPAAQRALAPPTR